ncbi:MAG: general secretion pathway protein GspB [Desulfobacterales bacterium]
MRVNKRFLIILAGLVFVGAAGIALNQKIRYHHRKVAAKRTIAAKTMVTAKKETRTQRPARLLDQKPVLSTGIEKKPLSPKKLKEPDRMRKETKMPPAPVDTSHAAPLVDLNRKAAPPKHPEKGTIAAKGVEQHEPKAKPEQFAGVSIKQTNDTKIEIQAIAWSKDPKGRLAVINGLILREGESIDNIMVVHIGKDMVVFKKDREEWKQLFGF